MGHRLSKIYTRTGDTGETGLGDGSRVPKDNPRVEAIGAVDELNSCVGLLLAEPLAQDLRELLTEAQHDLFELGGELSIPGHSRIQPQDVERLERALDRYNQELAPLKEFILPGGSRGGALCHFARTVCRRAERRVVTLASQQTLSEHCVRYLNRLSDLLFVLSRVINRRDGRDDVLWRKGRSAGPGQ
ncbi:MAG TPA: cob(I)yrinic acid a,c-diamide adenosyltransferase [Burkholderiales bacterium]|nr:cob(I)yrinic acid a,c-diamide adenosyltransferase [Burkholderiales bacterium]